MAKLNRDDHKKFDRIVKVSRVILTPVFFPVAVVIKFYTFTWETIWEFVDSRGLL